METGREVLSAFRRTIVGCLLSIWEGGRVDDETLFASKLVSFLRLALIDVLGRVLVVWV